MYRFPSYKKFQMGSITFGKKIKIFIEKRYKPYGGNGEDI